MVKNKPIRNNTDITGFLVIIINIPNKIETKELINRNSDLNPFKIVMLIKYIVKKKIILLTYLVYS